MSPQLQREPGCPNTDTSRHSTETPNLPRNTPHFRQLLSGGPCYLENAASEKVSISEQVLRLLFKRIRGLLQENTQSLWLVVESCQGPLSSSSSVCSRVPCLCILSLSPWARVRGSPVSSHSPSQSPRAGPEVKPAEAGQVEEEHYCEMLCCSLETPPLEEVLASQSIDLLTSESWEGCGVTTRHGRGGAGAGAGRGPNAI